MDREVAPSAVSPASFVNRWMRRGPMTAGVVGLGVGLLLSAWVGLRSVETRSAGIGYERVLLAQSSELQGQILDQLEMMDGLGRNLASPDGLPSVEDLRRDLHRSGIEVADSALTSVIVVEIAESPGDEQALREREAEQGNDAFAGTFDPDPSTRPNPILTRAYGGASSAPLGMTLDSEALRQMVSRVAGSDRTLAGSASAAEEIFDEALGRPTTDVVEPAVVLAAPIRDADGKLRGVVLGRLLLTAVFGQMRSVDDDDVVALEVLADQTPLVSSLPDAVRGDPFGEPVVFTQGSVTWAIQGYEAGYRPTHWASRAVLAAGLLLALAGGVLARAARRHAITLGRLQRSEYDARHDPLTGLLNRSGLTEHLQSRIDARAPGELLVVLFLDLDRLKVINDSIGHGAGDQVLANVGRRLTEITRGADTVGRFGGDEFVVVASIEQQPSRADAETGRDAITVMANRLLDVIGEPTMLNDESTQAVTASIGVAYVAEDESTSAESLLRDADLAMYRAKEAGGSCFEVFDAELRAQAVARLEVERELRRAIRTGQLVVHYQPIVDIRNGKVDRFEALVRWQHPVRGMVPPGQFLSVAAESGLIVDLGEHVLRESCRQVALWSSASGRSIRVSVNLAERQLLDRNLVPTVRRVLAETGISPSQLELELTEDLLVDRMGGHLGPLEELSAMGIKLAIDDFGTSRASLGQLKKLAMVDTLKIDRSFVVDVAHDSVDRKIINAIVALAESVGMEVVVEGVEHAEQVSALRQLGVSLIQGFYFQRPGPAEKALHSLARTFEVPEAATNADVD